MEVLNATADLWVSAKAGATASVVAIAMLSREG
jgi:hypothetical protein